MGGLRGTGVHQALPGTGRTEGLSLPLERSVLSPQEKSVPRPFFILPESRRRFLLWRNISPVTPAAARDTAGWEYCCVSPQRGVMWSQAGPPGGLGPGPARLWSPSTKPRGRRRGGRWGWGGGSEGRPGHIHSCNWGAASTGQGGRGTARRAGPSECHQGCPRPAPSTPGTQGRPRTTSSA